MIRISTILDEAKAILATCEEPRIYAAITQAVEALAGKGVFRSLTGEATLCVDGSCVVLPSDVQSVLAVKMADNVSSGRGWANPYHLNGAGKTPSIPWVWSEQLPSPVFRQPCKATRLVAVADNPGDTNAVFTVYGFGVNGEPMRQTISGQVVDGIRIPISAALYPPLETDPWFTAISRIYKDRTRGRITLVSFDAATNGSNVVGVYEAADQIPAYRKIELGREVDWVRVAYQRRVPNYAHPDDIVELESRTALMMMLRSLRAYEQGQLDLAVGYEATATRLLVEAENRSSPKVLRSPQIINHTSVGSPDDQLE